MRIIRATLALAIILTLAGCSQTNPSPVGSATTIATRSGPTAVATPSSGGGANAFDSTTPFTPAGYQMVTAPTSSLTFAVPKDWEDPDALPETQKALSVWARGVDSSTLTQRLSSTDTSYGRFSQSGGLPFNSVAVAKEAETSSTPPSQTSPDEIIARQEGIPTGCSTKPSTYGQAAVNTSIAQVQDTQTVGAAVAIPTSSDIYMHIAVTAGNVEEVGTIVSIILTTTH